MKKLFVFVVLLLFCTLLFAGCGDDSANGLVKSGETKTGYDIDLTVMSSTMVYSQVLDMLQYPKAYEGQRVKMRGNFTVWHSNDTGLYYPAVVIADATACCSQGIEFVLKDEPTYPDGYPESGTDVTVGGVFRIYYEGSNRFVHLVDSVLL